MRTLLIALLFSTALHSADFLRLEVGAPLINNFTGSNTFGSSSIDASNKQVAWVFQCTEAMTISHLGFRYSALGGGTPPAYRISLQGVNASGNPDGNIKGGGSPVSGPFTPPANATWDGTTRLIDLDNDYTCTRGEFLSAVIDSALAEGSNFSIFNTSWAQPSNSGQAFPTAQVYNGSAWTKSVQAPVFFYTSTTSKTYGIPLINTVTTARSSGAESAMFFSIPAGTFSTYKVAGIRAILTSPAAGKNIKVLLYSGTTVLQTSGTIDGDNFSAGSRLATIMFGDMALATLNAGTTYRIGISPQDASNNVALMGLTLHDPQSLTAFPGGASWGYSTRTGCGAPCDGTSTAWTDDSTVRPLMSLILAEATGGGAGGGGPFVIW